MRHALHFWLLTGILVLCSGCGGESIESRMRRQAKANAELSKLKEEKAAALGGGQTDAAPARSAAAKPAPPGAAKPSAILPTPSSTPVPAAAATPSRPLPPLATVEQRRAKTIENMEKIGQALNVFATKYAGYPATKVAESHEYPPMSWRVAILPLLGYDGLYKQYKPEEPWNSPSNNRVLGQIPPEFQSPERHDTKTNYLAPLASNAAFGGGRRLSPFMFEDGVDFTLILVEVDDAYAVEWTRPDDLPLKEADLKAEVGSLRGDGFFGVLASGRVCRIAPDTEGAALRALFTISGDDTGKIIDAIQEATPTPRPVVAVATSAKGIGASGGSVAGGGTLGPAGPPKVPATVPGAAPAATQLFKKLSVPSEAELAKARGALQELYTQDYQQARTPEARRELAKKLVESSHEVGDDHAAEYELLRIARDLAAQSGGLEEALQTVNQMDEKFQVDAILLRLETLRLFQKSPAAQTRAREIASQAVRLVIDAVATDRYDRADEALKFTLAAARRSGDQDLLARATAGQKWMDAAQKAFEDVPKATVRLEANQNDSQANQTVGVYTCLVKGRWEIGLPMLAKATDLKLRFLAKMDLVTSKTPPEMFDLANQYWDLAAEKPDLEKRGLQLRAAYWYSFAVRQLGGGLDKIKAQKRLSDIIAAYGKEAVEPATATKDIDKVASPAKTATDG